MTGTRDLSDARSLRSEGNPMLSPLRTARNGQPQAQSQWKSLPYLSVARQDAACASVLIAPDQSLGAKGIVVAGGRSTHNSALSSVELLEWNVQHRWWPLPNLSVPRCGCALVSLSTISSKQAPRRSQLFVIGGVNEASQPLASMESYIHGSGQTVWETVAEPMGRPRMYPAAVSFIDPRAKVETGHILVIGGRDHKWRELDTCELYSTSTGRWEQILPMSKPRFGCGAIYSKESHSVLVFGGYTGPDEEWTTSCERYDIVHDTWTPLPPMKEAVQFCQVTQMADEKEDYIMVRGSRVNDDSNGESILQCLHVPSGEWIQLPTKSSTIGAGLISVDRSRIVVIGGARGESANGLLSLDRDGVDQENGEVDFHPIQQCLFWMAEVDTLFGVLDKGKGTTSSSKESLPMTITATTPADDGTIVDDETTVHPFLYPQQAPTSVVAESAASVVSGRSSVSSRRSASTAKRKVEDHSTVDNFGVQVKFTGYVTMEGGRPHGKGKMVWETSGDRYEGSFDQGARQGRGKMIYSNGDSFMGRFQDDQREGKGIYHYRDGRVYDGLYTNDMAEDPKGKMEWKDGTVYLGQFSKSKRTGKGKITFPKSNVEYEGYFVNGKYHGSGVCRFGDGSVYDGQWQHGKAHGRGTLRDAEGNIVHKGKWVNDGPVYA